MVTREKPYATIEYNYRYRREGIIREWPVHRNRQRPWHSALRLLEIIGQVGNKTGFCVLYARRELGCYRYVSPCLPECEHFLGKELSSGIIRYQVGH